MARKVNSESEKKWLKLPRGWSDHIRMRLMEKRKILRLTQEDFGTAAFVDRSGYGRKETGQTPFLLQEVEAICNAHAISLAEICQGYPGFYAVPESKGSGLSEQAKAKYPHIQYLVLVANQAAESGNDHDQEFLRTCMKHAVEKMENGRQA